MSFQNQKNLGISLLILGGLIAITMAFVATASPISILAVFIMIWGVARVRDSKQPLFTGVITALLYVAVGGVAYFSKDQDYLLFMIMASWLADQIK